MNRRGFLGALAALLTVPAVAFTSRSVPRFIVDSANGCRFRFTPFGELDWIDMPSGITGLNDMGDVLEITCVGGVYHLRGGPDPETMFIRQIA